MMLLSTVSLAAPAVAGDGETNPELVQTLENGEDLYLSFGADLGEITLEEYVEAHANGDADEIDSEIVQYQDVGQVNVNVQGEAVSIAIDGGEATAVQETSQQNSNEQVGEADAENVDATDHQATFEEPGDVYLVFGNGDVQQFDGWAVTGDDGSAADLYQSASAMVDQSQDVEQLNYNEQSMALALAEGGSEAVALQTTTQYNENLQEGVSDATNLYATDEKKSKKSDGGVDAEQTAEASVDQVQSIEQVNYNEQGGAVAIAVGENSTATAIQVSDQENVNTQFGSATAENILTTMDGMTVATAGLENGHDNGVVSSESHTETGTDDKKGEKKDDADRQESVASVTQYQSAEQVNLNMQSAAVAIAVNGSEATAVQYSYQENYNAQVGHASAITAGGEESYDGTVYTDTTSVTLGGDAVPDNPLLSFDYDGSNEQLNDVDHFTSATVEQTQFVTQLNLNEQHAALAFADDGGAASAVQVSMQSNENYQFASAEAADVIAC